MLELVIILLFALNIIISIYQVLLKLKKIYILLQALLAVVKLGLF